MKTYIEYITIENRGTAIHDSKGKKIIEELFMWYMNNPISLKEKTLKALINEYDDVNTMYALKDKLFKQSLTFIEKAQLMRVVINYISGMTDKYAVNSYKTLLSH